MKPSNFNTYYDDIGSDFWRNLCVEKGILRQYDKGELFAEEGRIAKYLGYIQSGSLKYVVHSPDGTDAFDTIYIGAEKFPYHDTFALSVSGVS